ncbi:MAG: C40 family peptidase [Lachnospiraceae bacterium]
MGLPRTSAAQSQYGMKIPVSEAAPGDLIFYAKNGQVYHVVIYIGNGRTVEAASTRSGICSHGVNYANAVWATRLLS